jgi:hypothetical protein
MQNLTKFYETQLRCLVTVDTALLIIIKNHVQIIQNLALSFCNLALGLICENKKIMRKLYKIYY